MAGISATGGVSGVQFQTEVQMQVMKLQKDTMNMQGDMALKLLESAVVPQASGQQLNIQV